MTEPKKEFERIAEASKAAAFKDNQRPTSRRGRLIWAVVYAAFGPTLLLLNDRRFDGESATSWWVFVLVGLATAGVGYFLVPWALRSRADRYR